MPKIAKTIQEYSYGDAMMKSLRDKLIADVVMLNNLEPDVHRRDLSAIQDMSNKDLFLLWIRG